jgi:hypothetical protein
MVREKAQVEAPQTSPPSFRPASSRTLPSGSTPHASGGASWTVEIEKEIDRCDVLLALMTPGSYLSDIANQLRLAKSLKFLPRAQLLYQNRSFATETS